jgi:photoactive yellow protein
MSEQAFSALDVAGALAAEDGVELDRLPFGAVVVDRTGTIVEYNAYERETAGTHGRDVVGENFFRTVEPLAREFEGRFTDWLASDETRIAPFEFVFPYEVPQRVAVTFVRLSGDGDHATILIKRLPLEPEPAR